MASEESTIITPAQARAVLALEYERAEILRRANEQLSEIHAALQEQGRMLAGVHGLARDAQYRFESVDLAGERRIKLIAVPPVKEALPSAEEPPQADAEKEQGDGN